MATYQKLHGYVYILLFVLSELFVPFPLIIK